MTIPRGTAAFGCLEDLIPLSHHDHKDHTQSENTVMQTLRTVVSFNNCSCSSWWLNILHMTLVLKIEGVHTHIHKEYTDWANYNRHKYILNTSHPHMASNRAAKNVMDNICINNAVSLFISNSLGKIL